MNNIGKGTYWKIIFAITFLLYLINLFSIVVSQSMLVFTSSAIYNYVSIILAGIFVYTFYTSLKKGALTIRYVITMFVLLVLVPFLIAVLAGRITI